MAHSRDQLVGVEGTVKWFDPRKGFGFVVGPEGQDIFVHYSIIEGDGFKVLRDGAHVIYDATNTDKGWKATSVRRNASVTIVERQKALASQAQASQAQASQAQASQARSSESPESQGH